MPPVIDVFTKYLHMTSIKKRSGPSVASAFLSIFADPKSQYALIRGSNFLINIFRTCFGTRAVASSFRCFGTPTINVRSWNECIARFAVDSTNILHIKIHRDKSMFCRNLSRPTMTRFTRRLASRPRESPIRTCSPYGRESRWPVRAFASRKLHFGWGTAYASVSARCGLPRLPNGISEPRFSG